VLEHCLLSGQPALDTFQATQNVQVCPRDSIFRTDTATQLLIPSNNMLHCIFADSGRLAEAALGGSCLGAVQVPTSAVNSAASKQHAVLLLYDFSPCQHSPGGLQR
jgi:hypothetical protein